MQKLHLQALWSDLRLLYKSVNGSHTIYAAVACNNAQRLGDKFCLLLDWKLDELPMYDYVYLYLLDEILF